MDSLVVVQREVLAYRQKFFVMLSERVGGGFLLVAGEPGVSAMARLGVRTKKTRLRTAAGGRLMWQSGALREAVSADVTVLEFNPRIVSNVLVTLIRRILRRRVLLWGHAWSRSGPLSRTNLIRRAWAQLADGVIAYSDAERREISDVIGEEHAWVAPNALYGRDEIKAAPGDNSLDIVVSARLECDKRPEVALLAFAKALPEIPAGSKLVFVGDGPLAEELIGMTDALGIVDRVEFSGRVFDTIALAGIYARAIVALSPGYVGLSIVQCQSFGVPMIYSRNEPHAPEVSLASEGQNAIAVDGSIDGFADAIVRVFEERDNWAARRPDIASRCHDRHSIESMVNGFAAGAFASIESSTGT